MRLNRIRSLSLRWKLLIPFVGLSMLTISVLVLIDLRSQTAIYTAQEKQVLLGHFNNLLVQVGNRNDVVASLAFSIAHNPEIARLFAARDREALYRLMAPIFENLQQSFGIHQLHFHLPNMRSFLRVHAPGQFGDDLSMYRFTILDAIRTGGVVTGLEKGVFGIGVRGVLPIKWKGAIVGTMEVGWNVNDAFLESFKAHLGVDVCLYTLGTDGTFHVLFSTLSTHIPFGLDTLAEALAAPQPLLFIEAKMSPNSSVLLGHLNDFSGLPLMVVAIVVDRTGIRQQMAHSRNMMLMVQGVGILISAGLVLWIVHLFLRPIRRIVRMAGEIADRKRIHRLPEHPMDEMGLLTQSLNRMLHVLNQARERLERDATTLKERVAQRTSDLIASEEKFRTLVDRVPLVVYRLTSDGTLIFINEYFEELLGIPLDAMLGNEFWWGDFVLKEDTPRVEKAVETVLKKGVPSNIEYRCRAADGRVLYIVDKAVPDKSVDGRITAMEGIMVDATEHHRLQEKTIRAEELKTLHEVSLQLAHEIRNPLTTVGGFAHRLLKSLAEDDPLRKNVEIILQEVARLESILKMIQSYIQPFDLFPVPTDLNNLIERAAGALLKTFESRGAAISVEPDPRLGIMNLDPDLLSSVFDTLLRNALRSIPEGGVLRITTHALPETCVAEIRYPVQKLCPEDIDHFFFPFAGTVEQSPDLDLPRAKVIVHKHGGMMDVGPGDGHELIITIDLPTV